MKRFKVYFWRRVPISVFREIKRDNKDRLRDYMNVYVCEDFEEMYDLNDKLENQIVPRDYGARTLSYNKKWYDNESGEYVKDSPCNGYMIFNKKFLGINTIVHESSHGVIGYFSRKLKDHKEIFDEVENDEVISESSVNEELFAYMIGSIVEQIYINLDKLDIF